MLNGYYVAGAVLSTLIIVCAYFPVASIIQGLVITGIR